MLILYERGKYGQYKLYSILKRSYFDNTLVLQCGRFIEAGGKIQVQHHYHQLDDGGWGYDNIMTFDTLEEAIRLLEVM